MKKNLLLLILILSIGFSTFAQDKNNDFKNSIKFIPHKMLYNSLAIGYEREIGSSTSLYFLSQIIYSEKYLNYNKGFAQSIGIKNYVARGKEVLHVSPSFYYMPYIQAGSFDIQSRIRLPNSDNQPEYYLHKTSYFNYGGGFLIGFGLTLVKRIGVDFYFGGGVMFTDYHPEDLPDWMYTQRIQDLWEGVRAKGGLEFSYKF